MMGGIGYEHSQCALDLAIQRGNGRRSRHTYSSWSTKSIVYFRFLAKKAPIESLLELYQICERGGICDELRQDVGGR